jgi:hypothetical protein
MGRDIQPEVVDQILLERRLVHDGASLEEHRVDLTPP